MNVTPATKAEAQAMVRDKQANEASISGVPFFFWAILSAMTTDTPTQSDFRAKLDRFPKYFSGRRDRTPFSSYIASGKTLKKMAFHAFFQFFRLITFVRLLAGLRNNCEMNSQLW
jgi:hypothetical protein